MFEANCLLNLNSLGYNLANLGSSLANLANLAALPYITGMSRCIIKILQRDLASTFPSLKTRLQDHLY